MKKNNLAVVTSKNGNIYQVIKLEKDRNCFVGLTTDACFIAKDEQCKRDLTIPLQLNIIINKNPLVLDLIKALNLSYEK